MMDKNRIFETNTDDIKITGITPARFRDLVLAGMLSSGPGLETDFMPSPEELDTIVDMLKEAVKAGKFFDFGYWPNEFIKKQSTRAIKLYLENALGHPFTTPWIFYHTWSDQVLSEKFGCEADSCSVYLVNPYPVDGKAIGCDFEISSIEPFKVKDINMLGVGDRARLLSKEELEPNRAFACQVVPVQFRFPQSFWDRYAEETGLPKGPQAALESAASNVMEPIMVALLMLNTRGIPKETVRASDKLNSARIKNKKPLIPPYTKVRSEEYVTTFLRTIHEKQTSQGGHHASPVAHIRMGHWRNYKTGERTFINDTLVKATPEMRDQFKSSRIGYTVPKE
jgi:hypothetical protein